MVGLELFNVPIWAMIIVWGSEGSDDLSEHIFKLGMWIVFKFFPPELI